MSAADDVLSFEEQLRRLILEAVECAEKAGPEIQNRAAFVLGYVMGPVQFTPAERRALDARIHRVGTRVVVKNAAAPGVEVDIAVAEVKRSFGGER